MYPQRNLYLSKLKSLKGKEFNLLIPIKEGAVDEK